MGKNSPVILVSFGEPRTQGEVSSFLREILTDQELVRTPLPGWLHQTIFSLISIFRAPKLRKMYKKIEGESSFFADTEGLAEALSRLLSAPVIPFYRYLPRTHEAFLKKIQHDLRGEKIVVFPLFPQRSCVTTGSSQKWLESRLPKKFFEKLDWIQSSAGHPAFIRAWKKQIQEFLESNALKEEETILLFSAHGVPKKIIEQGDPY